MNTVDIVIPIYYGNKDEIEESVKEQIEFYDKKLKNYKWQIIIGINGENRDFIIDFCEDISKKYKNVVCDYTDEVGRGATLSKTWVNSSADLVCYMDVDLSTGLEALPIILKELENNDVCKRKVGLQ